MKAFCPAELCAGSSRTLPGIRSQDHQPVAGCVVLVVGVGYHNRRALLSVVADRGWCAGPDQGKGLAPHLFSHSLAWFVDCSAASASASSSDSSTAIAASTSP